MKKLYSILILIAVIAVVAVSCFFLGRRNAIKNAPAPQVDTVTVRDTIVDYKPIEASIPAGYELVPAGTLNVYEEVLSAYKDSLAQKPMLVTVHDTTYIAVPLSKTTFTDDKTYKCEVLGYGTKMLWHESYQETAYITKTTTVPALPKLALSPNLSAFATPKVFGLSAGLKVDVWSGNWRFSPGVAYSLIAVDKSFYHGPMITFETNYNLILK